MGKYQIIGGKTLGGEITVQGAKNAILPILASSLLSGGESIIHNCPNISDTHISIDILRKTGCKVNYENNTVVVNSETADIYSVPEKLVREMRSSIVFLGAILGRFKKAEISHPGGCELGERPIDYHIKSLREMGVNINDEAGFLSCETNAIKGSRIHLDFPSVGATENIMLAAVRAAGETVITNAAREPEIFELQAFLNSMGAKVSGSGTDVIRIEGTNVLHNCEYTIMPDRIVAGTYLAAAAITKGEVLLKSIVDEHVYPIAAKLSKMGCTIKTDKNSIYLKAPQLLKAIDYICTSPHPGFPTDMQPQIMSCLSLAKGTSIMYESVFESRNKHISELKRMGADITQSHDGKTFIVRGVDKLSGAIVEAKDLRGGAALILAALPAEGETTVLNSKHVERGYERISEDLESIGADIKYLPF